DPQFTEAARRLAVNAYRSAGDVNGRLDAMAVRVLARPLDDDEHVILAASLQTMLDRYAADPAAADALLHVGESPGHADIPAPTQAAWTMVASEILNLDEALIK